MNLEWNVYLENFNSRTIEAFNVFDHFRFQDDVKKALKQARNKKDFAEEIRHALMYYFWSKCEYEIVITSWVPRISKKELERLNDSFKEDNEKYGREPASIWVEPNVFKKVDVYEQIALNFDIFVDYIWSHKKKQVKVTNQTSLFDNLKEDENN